MQRLAKLQSIDLLTYVGAFRPFDGFEMVYLMSPY
jgi:hypothetical protein